MFAAMLLKGTKENTESRLSLQGNIGAKLLGFEKAEIEIDESIRGMSRLVRCENE